MHLFKKILPPLLAILTITACSLNNSDDSGLPIPSELEGHWGIRTVDNNNGQSYRCGFALVFDGAKDSMKLVTILSKKGLAMEGLETPVWIDMNSETITILKDQNWKIDIGEDDPLLAGSYSLSLKTINGRKVLRTDAIDVIMRALPKGYEYADLEKLDSYHDVINLPAHRVNPATN